jgi:hypothetical protein
MYTKTLHCAVFPPSAVVTVIVAVPDFTGVTAPLELTVTIAVSPELHVTFLLVAFAGATVAVRVSVSPTIKLRVLVPRLTLVTDTGGGGGVSSSSSQPGNMTTLNTIAIITANPNIGIEDALFVFFILIPSFY